ncbi:hypothetical protein K7432_010742 [Basidiobolus ranarum]|uniref:Uncharacterized protein n=1 Tax=Basidiobolus ranarum TaxID=34480 RepID=A0ABR2WNG1_9FUNG
MAMKLGHIGYVSIVSADNSYVEEKGRILKVVSSNLSVRLQRALFVLAVFLLGVVTLGISSISVNNPQIEFTIVTAASGNHFCPLQAFIYSLNRSLQLLPLNMKPRILVYDLGLNEEQHTSIFSLASEGMIDELLSFNYSMYPSFWDIKASRGEYAWKVGIIHEVAQKYPGVVLWMDSGNRVFPKFLADVVEHVELQGFYSPPSSGNVGQWMHPGMPQYFGDNIERYAEETNCNGAFVGVNSNNHQVMQSLIEPWFDCAMNKECIAPVGSSRVNHRQDQAALTYLTLNSRYRCSYESFKGLLIHQDKDCERQIASYRTRQQKLSRNSYWS